MPFEEKTIEISRFIAAPRELVFRLWTKREFLARWFGPRRCTIEIHRFDFRVGGELRMSIVEPDGSSCDTLSEFLEIVPRERIVYRVSVEKTDSFPASSTVEIDFSDEGTGTRLVLRQDVPEALARKTGAYPSWLEVLDRLEEGTRDESPALEFFFHPLASFCHKVLIALYENETPFVPLQVDLLDPASSAPFFALWPVGKMPILREKSSGRVLPETTIILEYLELHHPGPRALLPRDPGEALEVRLWDRFFDLYVQTPMQKIVVDRLRAENERDPRGVAEAREMLQTAYALLERKLEGRAWIASNEFSIADCAAAPALFYALIVEPAKPEFERIASYIERLVTRPSFARVLEEARPYLPNFPLFELVPARFR